MGDLKEYINNYLDNVHSLEEKDISNLKKLQAKNKILKKINWLLNTDTGSQPISKEQDEDINELLKARLEQNMRKDLGVNLQRMVDDLINVNRNMKNKLKQTERNLKLAKQEANKNHNDLCVYKIQVNMYKRRLKEMEYSIIQESINLKNSTVNNSDCTTQICSLQDLQLKEEYKEIFTHERDGMRMTDRNFEEDELVSLHDKKYNLCAKNQEDNSADNDIAYDITEKNIKIQDVDFDGKFVKLQNISNKKLI
ncbi:hypothetical protein ACS0PU_002371 [Formica fusca]